VTRFVRLHPHGRDIDPRGRLRLEYDPSHGNAYLVDENVLPEHILNPDARHAKISDDISLRPCEVQWLLEALADLAAHMAPQLVEDAEFDRRRGMATDRIRALADIVDAALAWRQGDSAAALVKSIDAAAAEGHVVLPPDRSRV